MIRTKPVLYEVMLLGSGSRRLARAGSDSRELDYYKCLSQTFEVWIFEYDEPTESWERSGIASLPRRFHSRLLQSILGALMLPERSPRPALIRTKQFWGAWTGVLFKFTRRAPLVIRMGYHWSQNVIVERHIQSRALRWLLRRFERFLVERADGVIFGSPHIAEAFKALRPSIVVPNGVNHERFFPRPSECEFDLIYVGRLIPIKGVDRLARLVPPALRLCVIGEGPDADALFGRRERTRWIAHVSNDQLPTYLQAARCFLSLSRAEGSPKALLEAVFCGCFPILSEIPAHRAIVDDLGYGALVGPDATPEQITKLVAEAAVVPEKLELFRKRFRMDRLAEIEAVFLTKVIHGV